MSILPELKALLKRGRKAANRSADGSRYLASSSSDEAFNSILQEVTETFLPRRLVFSLDDTDRLVVEAGDGKLRAVIEVTPPELARPELSPGSSPIDVRHAAAARSVLRGFADLGGALYVMPEAPEHFRNLGLPGLDPDEIRNTEPATGPSAGAPSSSKAGAPVTAAGGDTSLVGRFYAMARDFTETRAISAEDSGLASKEGDDAGIPLEYLLRTFASQIAMNAPFTDSAMPGPKAIILGSRQSEMPSAVCFSDGKRSVVGTMNDPEIASALDQVISLLNEEKP